MIGTILGYFKNFPKYVEPDPVKIFVSFIFVTVNFGLLVMLLTMVPSSLCHPNVKERFSYTLAELAVVEFVGIEFMGMFISLVFFLFFSAVAVWCKKFIQEDNRRSQSSSALSHEIEPGMSLFSSLTTTELTKGHENESSTSSFNKELMHQSDFRS